MFSLAGINWLAVIVGVVVSNVLGFLWYGPLFGQTWAKALGKKMEDLQGSPTMYVVTIVASFLTMVVLAAAVAAFGSASLIEGAVVGAVLWFGIGATSAYVSTTFEGKNPRVFTLNALYNLAVFVVMGAVFAAW